MTNSSDGPDWNQLPGNPAGFFGFHGPFDQKELKRRYNQLIKRFKPEKSPDEFQRIRAAYEMLEQRLRQQFLWGFHVQQVQQFQPNEEPEPEPETKQPVRAELPSSADDYEIVYQAQPQSQTSRPRRLAERVRESDPATLLLELNEKPNRTDEEQLLLTFLQDATEPETSFEFLDGLLSAVKSGHDDQALVLLQEYLQTDEARGRCQEFLERIFIALPNDDVFSLTQPLWDELQSRVRFTTFLEVWHSCVRHIHHHQFGRVLFEVRLLRRMMFYAPIDWTTVQLAKLAHGDIGWPESLDSQIYLLERLVEYMRDRSKFLRKGNKLRAKLDAVIQAYCVEASDFERRFLELNNEFRQDFSALSAAFPARNPIVAKVWNTWALICDQLTSEISFAFPSYQAQTLARHELSRLPVTLNWHGAPLLRSPQFWPWWNWLIAGPLLLMLPFGFLALFFFTGPHPEGPIIPWMMGGVGLFIGGSIYSLYGVIDVSAENRFTWSCYCMGIRRQLVSFLHRAPLPVTQFLSQLRTFRLSSARAQHQLEQIERDFALRFLATAIWFKQ